MRIDEIDLFLLINSIFGKARYEADVCSVDVIAWRKGGVVWQDQWVGLRVSLEHGKLGPLWHIHGPEDHNDVRLQC